MSATARIAPLLAVRDLSKHFPVRRGIFSAPPGRCMRSTASPSTRDGETLGLVGESGCGKSTAGR